MPVDPNAERARKAAIAVGLREMRNGAAYKAVLARIEQRCGKWFHAWIKVDDAKAAALRETAKGYFAFDELVTEMIHEGETAEKILKGEISPASNGQGATNE